MKPCYREIARVAGLSPSVVRDLFVRNYKRPPLPRTVTAIEAALRELYGESAVLILSPRSPRKPPLMSDPIPFVRYQTTEHLNAKLPPPVLKRGSPEELHQRAMKAVYEAANPAAPGSRDAIDRAREAVYAEAEAEQRASAPRQDSAAPAFRTDAPTGELREDAAAQAKTFRERAQAAAKEHEIRMRQVYAAANNPKDCA